MRHFLFQNELPPNTFAHSPIANQRCAHTEKQYRFGHAHPADYGTRHIGIVDTARPRRLATMGRIGRDRALGLPHHGAKQSQRTAAHPLPLDEHHILIPHARMSRAPSMGFGRIGCALPRAELLHAICLLPESKRRGLCVPCFLVSQLSEHQVPSYASAGHSELFLHDIPTTQFHVAHILSCLLGAMVPYWFYAAIAIWENQLDTAFLYLEPWLSLPQPDYSQLSLPQWITAGTMAFLAIMALVHFFHTAYNDKIRTRMLIYVITTMEFIIMAGLLLVPKYFDELMRLFIANSSTLIAHHYALGKGRFFNAWFYLILMLLGALGIYNYLFSV